MGKSEWLLHHLRVILEHSEFRLFHYGPLPTDSEASATTSVTPKICKSLYSWELPSDIALCDQECNRGDCLVRKAFLNDDLPYHIVWQQKKEMVLGFGILDSGISTLLDVSDDFDGFTLIRLMSTGKLEAQRYFPSSEFLHKSDAAHAEPSLLHYGNLIYSMGDEDYKFPKRFKYVNLNYLNAYLNGNLMEAFGPKLKVPCNSLLGQDSCNLESHEIMCKKLKDCGFGQFRSSPATCLVFDDITVPTSVCEVAKKQLWATLPIEILQLAFSNYSEFLETLVDQKKVPLEFLVVPDLEQLPPFLLRKPSCRSNRSESFVGPALPLPFLLTLCEYCNGCPSSQEDYTFSPETELAHTVDVVMEVAGEVAAFLPDDDDDDDDGDKVALNGLKKSKSFYMHHHSAMFESENVEKVIYSDDKHERVISKLRKKGVVPSDGINTTGVKMFDDLCPIELKFEGDDVDDTNYRLHELEAYNLLNRQFGMWQKNFNPYRQLSDRLNKVRPL